ncbi:MAG: fructosamine kinase family protein [Leeuwenhoekiella sp.]
MLAADFKEHLENSLNAKILQAKPLTGGDINEALLLTTAAGNRVIKLNDKDKFPKMFAREAEGLQLLATTKTFQVPEVHLHGEWEHQSYLVMEYIPQGREKDDFWALFGKNLAKLHRNSRSQFGLHYDNYIGSLPQYNTAKTDAAEFYITQRLEPQFKIAAEGGYSFDNISAFYKKTEAIIPKEPSGLIHGDLWSGNYLVNTLGEPALIDPAVSFAPREMDIGLMHLFGGFDESLYDSYNQIYPLSDGWQERTKLWQLYYVLVHVNLFGGGYYASAKGIMKNYL